MSAFIQEIKYGARALLGNRAFTITVFLTLAVCIAVNATTFAIVNSVVLRPLPVADADSILMMSNRYPNAGAGDLNWSSAADYYDRLREVTVFEEQAMFSLSSPTLEIEGAPERIVSMVATPSLFRLLRVAPAMGRAFMDEEGEIGAERKVILTYALWQKLYGGDPAVLGRDLRLSGRSFTVVGVMPRGFVFMNPEVRLWTPLAFTAEQKNGRHSNNWHNVGRLKAGATLPQAQSQIDALNAANHERFPEFKEALVNAGFHTAVERLQDVLVKDVKGILYLLWGGAVFVLLIGGLNIANLALARLTLRKKEIATRLALGARRRQITRQFVLESTLVTLAGGVAGVVIGSALLRTLAAFGLDQIPRAHEIRVDGLVVLVAVAMAVGLGVAIGLLSSAASFSVNLNQVLHEEGRTGTAGKGSRRTRQLLVVAQVGFAFVLLVGSGLLLASFRRLLHVDPGFTSEGVLTVSTNAPSSRYPGRNELRMLMARALDAIRAVPGVTAAGATDSIPFSRDYNDSVILAEGYVMKPGESLISPRQLRVTPGYLEAMRTRLLQGRYFDERDNETGPGAVIVDDRLAARFWPGQTAIGQRMYMPQGPEDLINPNPNAPRLTVVGVVRTVRLEDLAGTGSPVGAYYFPYAQLPTSGFTFAVRTSGELDSVARAIRAEMARIDPELALFDVRSMVERAELSLASRRTSLMLAVAYGALALFLSAVGLYGVLAYHVTQRRREFGIRMALGASGGSVRQMVLRQGLILALVGVLVGVGGSLGLTGLMSSLLYQVQATDPLTYGGVAVMLLGVAFVACYVPARRATKVDPIVTLRCE